MSEWPKQTSAPIPLKFELTPVVNLLTHENVDKRHNVSSAKILKW